MVKKRKLNTAVSTVQKSPVEVIIEDVSKHPMCLHGPTLLFSSEKGRYFACASCRDKKDCTLYIDEEDWKKEGVRKRNEKYYNLIPKLDKESATKNLYEVKTRHASDRAFCNTCRELFNISQTKKHRGDHSITTPLTEEQLKNPSTWLPTLENDCQEAQYLFSKKAVSTILGILSNNKIRNILCIGTPTVYEAAQANPDFDSILLDFDTRHHKFHPPDKYLWYNMFNNYLFDGNDEKVLKKFFKASKEAGVCIVMDPPFGGRVEPLVHTIKELSATHNQVCKSEGILPVIWAFPYFSEPYITNMMPDLKMHDYQVEYLNHKKFQNSIGGRKQGSAVRFYTNLPLRTIDLSNDSNYKYCNKCKYWVGKNSIHCHKCKQCSGKDGTSYVHCELCKRCVKPTYKHCKTCERCCHVAHKCGTIVESQSCYNCNEKGHKVAECQKQTSKKLKSK